MDLGIIPNEMWIHIFERVSRSADLVRVMQTCTRFYALALRVLYKRIVWRDPRHFASNMSFWPSNPTLLTVPTSLVVGISCVPVDLQAGEQYALVKLNGTLERFPKSRDPYFTRNSGKPAFFMSSDLNDAMLHRMSTFSHLGELVFQGPFLPESIHHMVHSFPSLRSLHIQNCVFAPSLTPHPDHSSLPIEELSL